MQFYLRGTGFYYYCTRVVGSLVKEIDFLIRYKIRALFISLTMDWPGAELLITSVTPLQ
jgi:hypothetical protein